MSPGSVRSAIPPVGTKMAGVRFSSATFVSSSTVIAFGGTTLVFFSMGGVFADGVSVVGA